LSKKLTISINNCRACDSRNLSPVIDLGEQYFSGYFPDPNENIEHLKAPLILIRCNECTLVQIKQSFAISQMYGAHYGYRSGLNSSMVEHLRLKSVQLIVKYQIGNTSNILDIGANDGTFLRNFSSVGSRLTAIDPTIPNWIENYDFDVQLIETLFDEKILDKVESKYFDLITSISMFYDVPDPIGFAKIIKKLLSPEGIWHIELSYLPYMLENNSFDTICHEHLEYYSLSSMQYIMSAAGLKIINVGFNRINGGSIYLDLTHQNNFQYKSQVDLKILIEKEKSKIDAKSWFVFRSTVNANIENIQKSIYDIVSSGNALVGIGASTKGNVILQALKCSPTLIKFIGEINSSKFGKVTPGTNIPILPEIETQRDGINYKFILPWHFKNHIMQNEKYFLKKGGKLIFPLPNLEIIGNDLKF
jgi:2-polyprenyl-3-methyl-5-hydroxy-6-metoxy-1,4-benzoquinol methylase